MSLNSRINLQVNVGRLRQHLVVNKSVESESFNMVNSTIRRIPCLAPLVTAGSSFEVYWMLFTFVHLCQYTVAGVLGAASQRTCSKRQQHVSHVERRRVRNDAVEKTSVVF